LSKSKEQELIIIAGPNGSGKTTLAKEYLATNKGNYMYLNADEIAYEINPVDPISVRLEAGKEFFDRFDRFIKDHKNVLIETMLSGKSVSNLIKQVRKQGRYFITLIFIFLDNEELCIERVKTRVSKGGHSVPEKDIVRRFGRSIVNFWEMYRHLSDRWLLYYNTENHFQQVAHSNENHVYVYDESLYLFFKELKEKYE
jgi:predicted ABC-type ATPase